MKVAEVQRVAGLIEQLMNMMQKIGLMKFT